MLRSGQQRLHGIRQRRPLSTRIRSHGAARACAAATSTVVVLGSVMATAVAASRVQAEAPGSSPSGDSKSMFSKTWGKLFGPDGLLRRKSVPDKIKEEMDYKMGRKVKVKLPEPEEIDEEFDPIKAPMVGVEQIADMEKHIKKNVEDWGETDERLDQMYEDMIEVYDTFNLHTRKHKMIQRLYDLRRFTLGLDHRLTMQSQRALALSYGRFNHHATKKRLLTQAVAVQKRVCGADDSDTLETMAHLGMAIGEEGRIADSVNMLRGVLEKQQKVLDKDDPTVIHTLRYLASVLIACKRSSISEEMLQSALTLSDKVHGLMSKESIDIHFRLAGLYQTLVKPKQAKVHLDYIAKIVEEKHGPGTMAGAAILAEVGSQYIKMGFDDSGCQQVEKALKTCMEKRRYKEAKMCLDDVLRVKADQKKWKECFRYGAMDCAVVRVLQRHALFDPRNPDRDLSDVKDTMLMTVAKSNLNTAVAGWRAGVAGETVLKYCKNAKMVIEEDPHTETDHPFYKKIERFEGLVKQGPYELTRARTLQSLHKAFNIEKELKKKKRQKELEELNGLTQDSKEPSGSGD